MNLNLSSEIEAPMKRFLLIGLAVWLVATILIRLAPAGFLRPDRTVAILLLYGVSFGVMYLAIRLRVVRSLGSSEGRLAVIALVLPSLILDAFASAFFPTIY